MTNSLSLLTWNVQMRSWGMETLADKAFPPSTTAEERAEIIAKKLESSPRDFDVVCLNEVFDEDSRAILEGRLCGAGGRFPWAVPKCDLDLVRVRTGDDVATIEPSMWIDLLGLGGLITILELVAHKFEDSGLMVLSRLPFARRPLPLEFTPLLGTRIPLSWAGDGVPDIAFSCYGDSSDNDAMAAKGVLHAAFQYAGETMHLFASHTQADSKRSGENNGDRKKQMQVVADFVKALAGDPPAPDDLVVFCGDLNIVGGQSDSRGLFDAEWHDRFDIPGSGPLADVLVDVWGRDQCRGARAGVAPAQCGLRDPGITAPVVYEPTDQRLDYVFVNAAGGKVVQHLRVDHELSLVPRGIEGVGYLSDHKPLAADINRRAAQNRPAAAKRLTANPNISDMGALFDGLVAWYRFDEDGTYEFSAISLAGSAVGYEVYLDTDLSTPWPQFRREFDPEYGQRFVLPSAPFLVKVFMREPRGELKYELRAHRHLGDRRDQAIELPPGTVRHDEFPNGQGLGHDDPMTLWNDTDTRWYRISAPTVVLMKPFQMRVLVQLEAFAETGAVVRVLHDDNPGLSLLYEGAIDTFQADFSWESGPNEHFYLCVQRRDTGGVPLGSRVSLICDFSVLKVRPGAGPRLVCVEETSGWGSDDISWTLRADGHDVAHASNDDFGDMDDEDIRDLQPWLAPGAVYYVDKLELEVREEDDFDPDDVGVVTVEPFANFAVLPGVQVAGGTARGTVSALVDDGRYALHCEIARWDPEN